MSLNGLFCIIHWGAPRNCQRPPRNTTNFTIALHFLSTLAGSSQSQGDTSGDAGGTVQQIVQQITTPTCGCCRGERFSSLEEESYRWRQWRCRRGTPLTRIWRLKWGLSNQQCLLNGTTKSLIVCELNGKRYSQVIKFTLIAHNSNIYQTKMDT